MVVLSVSSPLACTTAAASATSVCPTTNSNLKAVSLEECFLRTPSLGCCKNDDCYGRRPALPSQSSWTMLTFQLSNGHSIYCVNSKLPSRQALWHPSLGHITHWYRLNLPTSPSLPLHWV